MSYNEYSASITEEQGESFTKSFFKKTGAIWEANEEGVYVLKNDATGAIVDSGDLTKAGDNLSLTVFLGKTLTATLDGAYTLRCYQTDTGNTEVNNLIAKYKIKYESGKVE